MNILLLVANAAKHTGTVVDHITAFEKFSRNNIVVLDSFVAGQINFDLDQFDTVVFHYSIVISSPNYLPEAFVDRLAEYQGLKILFIQDEFRWVDRTAAMAEKLGIAVIFTVVNKDVVHKIYRHPYFNNVRFEQTLTGFVPEHLLGREVPSFKDRSLDIIYRARKLPGWCGSFARQKWQIGTLVEKEAKKFGLKTDIATSEESRIYGEAWIDFVASAKATLGTGSGSSFIDFTGEVIPAVDKFETEFPDSEFEEVKERFLEGRDGDIVIDVISPRVFEAAALRTLLIMYPGSYSGAVQPGRHYVELNTDHSNMAEVVAILQDPKRAGEIIDRAYKEVACSGKWTFQTFVKHFDQVVEEEFSAQSNAAVSSEKTGMHIARMQRANNKNINRVQRAYKFTCWRVEATQKIKSGIVKYILVGLNRGARFVRWILPARLAEPIVAAVWRIAQGVKPLLKRIILGRRGLR